MRASRLHPLAIADEGMLDTVRRLCAAASSRDSPVAGPRGQSPALFGVLETLGVETSDEVRVRITGCRDLDQLDSTGDDLFS
ncbi:MAG: hypothetical protein ACRDRK_01350 [Pseudonocardia sp.]